MRMKICSSLLILTSVVVGLCSATTDVIHREQKNGRRPSGLSMDEFNTILSTDVYDEFGDTQQDAMKLWNTATLFEWKRAEHAEAQHEIVSSSSLSSSQQHHLLRSSVRGVRGRGASTDTQSYPYIVCDPEANKSGVMAKSDIESHFGSNLTPLYNRDDKTCFFVYVPASIAQSAPKPLKVQPLLSEMKISKGLVNQIQQDPPSKFQALFCPGLAGTKQLAYQLGQSIIDTIRNNGGKHTGEYSLVSRRFLRMDLHHPSHETDFIEVMDVNTDFSSSSDRFRMWHSTFQNGIDSDSDSKSNCAEMFDQIHIFGTTKGDSFVMSFSEEGSIPNSSQFSSSCLLSLVAGLAIQTEICSVGGISTMKELNIQAQWITQSDVEDERPWFDAGLTGRGQVVAVSDTGVDVDNCYFWDSSGDVAKNGSVDNTRRKVIQYVPFADDSDRYKGHGTHVAGTVAGRRAVNGEVESNGKADGVARDAKIAFFDIGVASNLEIPYTVDVLMDPGKSANAKIHSASWGAEMNTYDFTAKDFDDYIYDDEDFLVIVAAGNSGEVCDNGFDCSNTVGSPAISKNTITVGASQSAGPDVISSMKGKDYLADFSSRGPTADGRTKPEVVAPGYYILSAAAYNWRKGECDDSNGIHFEAGTSMAAPVVSGAAALIRQYFEEGWYPTGKPVPSDAMNPSGTLVKAVLLNGAQYLKGVQNGFRITQVSPYDNDQNFGRIDLMNSLRLDEKNNIDILVMDRKKISDGATDTIDVTISTISGRCNASELSATLVWMDPSGVPNCQQCVLNDLDLYLTKTGDTNNTRIYPNGLGRRDSVNNAERVRIKANDGDNFTVNVEAHDLETSSQTYSLVVTGCFVNESPPTLSPAPTVSPDNTTIPTSSPITPAPTSSPITPAPTSPPITPAPTSPPITPVPTSSPTSPAPPGPEKSSLATTFSGKTRSYGNMFDVSAQKDIKITGMDINTELYYYATVEIYTKKGSHVNYENEASYWTMIGSALVLGQGLGNPTSLPSGTFDPVSISSGSTQAFYVTLTSQFIVYSDGTRVGNVAASNSDMKIREGVGNIYPFGTTFSPRVWNGRLEYYTSAPRGDSLATRFDGTEREGGNMFDVRAHRNVIITGMDINTRRTDNVDVEIYTKKGTHVGFESDCTAWIKIGSVQVDGKGVDHKTPLPNNSFDNVKILSGERQAFYVTLTSRNLVYSEGEQVGKVAASNLDIDILEGCGKSYKFGKTYSPRVWNGILRYSVFSSSSLATAFDGRYKTYGNMFDINAKQDIVITAMDIHTEQMGSVKVEIYTKTGSHVNNENSASFWTKICSTYVIGQGLRNPTHVPKDALNPIKMKSGDIQAFYVTLNSPSVVYSMGEHVGKVAASNSDMEILEGIGNAYLFGLTSSPHVWNGEIIYSVGS